MSKAPTEFLTFSLLRRPWPLLVALWLGWGSLCPALAQAPYDDVKTTEGWAWSQIKQGNWADFNKNCGTKIPLDPRKEADSNWQNDCRKLSAHFLEDLLTQAPWRDAVPRAGVRIIGARIVGYIDLENARLTRSVEISNSWIAGGISLRRARTDSLIMLSGVLMNGTFEADSFHSESDLFLRNAAAFKSVVNLISAKIDGNVDMIGASFGGALNANSLNVGGSLFMRSDAQNKASFKDVNLRGANVKGQIDMTGASFEGTLDADGLAVGGLLLMRSDGPNKASYKAVVLRGANVKEQIDMTGATFEGKLNADALQVGGMLLMRSDGANKPSFKEVVLRGANVKEQIDMTGATFEGALNAGSLHVGGDLYMRSPDAQNKASFKDVNLRGANVTGQIDMTGANFGGALDADGLAVGGLLLMRSDGPNKASYRDVVLRGAKVAGQIDMSGASFEGALNAASLHVEGSLYMRSPDAQNKASYKAVVLRGAKVTGQINMDGANFGGALNADSVQVGSDLFMRSAQFVDQVIMYFVHVGANLDLRGATLTSLDLAGASVAGDLRLGGSFKSAVWKGQKGEPGTLNLRNTHIGNLMDAEDAWPAQRHLHLNGFTLSHLGGFAGDGGSGTPKRGSDSWDKWARLDPDYSPGPYVQLATALTSAGDRDAANDIRYLGRARERETEKGLAYVWSGFLQWVAGFGIGDYAFRVLYWAIGIAFLGALYLRMCAKGVRDKNHGFAWCFGASLSRLLPVIEINKEFTDFFNDPDRGRLTAWQSFVFSAIGMVGWLFGAILLAAVSGLTQSQ